SNNFNSEKPNPAYDYMELSKFDKRFLKTIVEESKLDFVGFHDIHLLCKHHNIEITNFEKLIEGITSKGYRVSRVHSNPYGLKTDMPIKELMLLLK
ncbi:MAG TPA: tRNA (guanine(10)-N(2))-dimethyltransferase, partial [Alphaproteobacteria bacterium]|nr:tRNA (guanine(10)-N(2))-dimethyltransferase [Alphaproteobacteria bacterium]